MCSSVASAGLISLKPSSSESLTVLISSPSTYLILYGCEYFTINAFTELLEVGNVLQF